MLNILVLCTGNSARSILGESLFNHLGAGRVRAYSAGSHPTGQVNPMALETLARHGIALPDARSKSWDEFALPGAPTIDFVITVCASAAGEACPYWPGHPVTAHWGIDDPAHIEPIEARRQAFEVAYQQLNRRVGMFLALPLESLTPEEITAAAKQIHAESDLSLLRKHAMNSVTQFFDSKSFAVVGATNKVDKYGYKVWKRVCDLGKPCYPIHPSLSDIDGIKTFKSLEEIPEVPEAVIIIVAPEITEKVVRGCKQLGIKKIWMQPGAESENAITFCNENGISLVFNDCVLSRLGSQC